MRWTMGLMVFFTAVFLMNGVFLYLAFSGREPVAESYEREAR
jgi:hypothetical protein